jgi:hypothetical protein
LAAESRTPQWRPSSLPKLGTMRLPRSLAAIPRAFLHQRMKALVRLRSRVVQTGKRLSGVVLATRRLNSVVLAGRRLSSVVLAGRRLSGVVLAGRRLKRLFLLEEG